MYAKRRERLDPMSGANGIVRWINKHIALKSTTELDFNLLVVQSFQLLEWLH